jgi:hypothetical protein
MNFEITFMKFVNIRDHKKKLLSTLQSIRTPTGEEDVAVFSLALKETGYERF